MIATKPDFSVDFLYHLPAGAESKKCQHCGTTIRYIADVRITETGELQEWGTVCAGVTPFERDNFIMKTRQREEWSAVLADRPEVAALLAAADARQEWVREVEAAGGIAPRLSYEVFAAVRSIRGWHADADELEEGPAVFAAWTAELEARPEPLRASQWLGTVGERLTVSGTVATLFEFEPYCWGAERTLLIVLRTADNDCVVTKTTAQWRHGVELDAHITLTGTVKRHGEYNGEAQTELTRCRLA